MDSIDMANSDYIFFEYIYIYIYGKWTVPDIYPWCPCIKTRCLFLLIPHMLIHTWWHHQMETFFALLALCVGNSPVTGEFPTQRPVTRSFGVFFDMSLNKRLSKQSRRRWFKTSSRSLWRHCNDKVSIVILSPYTCLFSSVSVMW